MNSSVVDYDFAKAWDQHQGSFAHGIAQKLLSYGERTNKNFKNVYDIVCGASNLLSFFNEKGLKCFGTEKRKFQQQHTITQKICMNCQEKKRLTSSHALTISSTI